MAAISLERMPLACVEGTAGHAPEEWEMNDERRVYFLWQARCTGTPFIVEGYEVVSRCPVCGEDDAFERSHCVRINSENLLKRDL